jgi:hypothetical protein
MFFNHFYLTLSVQEPTNISQFLEKVYSWLKYIGTGTSFNSFTLYKEEFEYRY